MAGWFMRAEGLALGVEAGEDLGESIPLFRSLMATFLRRGSVCSAR